MADKKVTAADTTATPDQFMTPGEMRMVNEAREERRYRLKDQPRPKLGDRFKKGGKVSSSASKRADGIAQRGKTRGKFV